jgi:hypothetical protein
MEIGRRLRVLLFPLFLALVAAPIACTSPEATRARGGGSGGDVGNRQKEVRMHSGSQPYLDTPTLIPAKHPELEPARQAAHLANESRNR